MPLVIIPLYTTNTNLYSFESLGMCNPDNVDTIQSYSVIAFRGDGLQLNILCSVVSSGRVIIEFLIKILS